VKTVIDKLESKPFLDQSDKRALNLIKSTPDIYVLIFKCFYKVLNFVRK